MSIEAIKHYEAALLEVFSRGATDDLFEHWNKARQAIADLEKQEPVAWLYESPMPDGSVFVGASAERLSIGVAVTSETIEKPLYTHPPKREPLTDVDYANACLSYRHDFGLMTQEQRDKLMFQAKEWARAFGIKGEA